MENERWPQPLRSPDTGGTSGESDERSHEQSDIPKIGEFETWGDVFHECKKFLAESKLDAVQILDKSSFDKGGYSFTPLDVAPGGRPGALDNWHQVFSRYEGHQSGGFDLYHGSREYIYKGEKRTGWVMSIVHYENKRPRMDSKVAHPHLYEK